MANQGKLLRIQTYLGFSFVRSLPSFDIETHGSILSMFFLIFLLLFCVQKYLVCIGP